MNSIIEAQEEFTNCFGELTLRHLTSKELVLPHFSNEKVELDQFIADHQKPAPVRIDVSIQDTAEGRWYYFNRNDFEAA
jgi:hypothetical protein